MESTHHRWIQALRSTMYHGLLSYPWLLGVHSQDRDKMHPSLKWVSLQFYNCVSFFPKISAAVSICQRWPVQFFCVKCFELFRYLHLQPKVASNQSCWQSLDSGAHRPTRHWSSQLRFVKRQISRSKMSRSKRVYLSISCFWQGLKGKKSVVSHPPHPKLTNVP